MSQIESEFQTDKNLRCAMKHALASAQYAEEVYYAHISEESTDFYSMIVTRTYEQLIAIASLFLGLQEIVPCWRCLVDKLSEKHINSNQYLPEPIEEAKRG